MNIEIERINKVIEAYFKANPTITIVPAKNLMPQFIAAGIFKKDFKNGLPIRKVLRSLESDEQLAAIPTVYAQGKDVNTYWYFVPTNAPKPTTPYKQTEAKTDKKSDKQSRLLSDESYVIDLCDTVLQLKAERQKRFPFLLGDLHKDGVSRTQLPVDAYYESLNLAVEFKEAQHTESIAIFDKPDVTTVSGVSRGEQRKIYDQRRLEVLPANGIKVVEIHYSDFEVDSKNQIIRSDKDLEIVKKILTENM